MLTDLQNLTLARAARVVAQDKGLPYMLAVKHVQDHPEDVEALSVEFADLAKALRPAEAAPAVAETPAPAEAVTE